MYCIVIKSAYRVMNNFFKKNRSMRIPREDYVGYGSLGFLSPICSGMRPTQTDGHR